jgi:hypothetical protein
MKKKIFGFALVLFVFSVGFVFASPPKEGYYRNSKDYIIAVLGSGSSWTIKHMNPRGEVIGSFDSTSVTTSQIFYRAYGTTYSISFNGRNSEELYDTYTNAKFTFYQNMSWN